LRRTELAAAPKSLTIPGKRTRQSSLVGYETVISRREVARRGGLRQRCAALRWRAKPTRESLPRYQEMVRPEPDGLAVGQPPL
jgi:hypothetical protein